MTKTSAVKRLRLRIVKAVERARSRRRQAEDDTLRMPSWRGKP